MADVCSGLQTNAYIASGRGLLSVQHLSISSISEEIKELKIPRFLNNPCWDMSSKPAGKTRLWNIWILSTTSSVFYKCQMSLTPHTTAGKTMLYFILNFSRETLVPSFFQTGPSFWLCWLPSNKSRENWLSHIFTWPWNSKTYSLSILIKLLFWGLTLLKA